MPSEETGGAEALNEGSRPILLPPTTGAILGHGFSSSDDKLGMGDVLDTDDGPFMD